jgi:hypothetical protein
MVLPNLAGSEDIDATKEERGVGGTWRVLAIGWPLLDKLVGIRREPDVTHEVPDSEILEENLNCLSLHNICDPV